MNNPSPRFTGLFIPAEIWAIEDLTLLEINLLAWIDALYSQGHGGCFASNEYLACKMRGVKENTIAKAIGKLRDLGLVEDVSFDGRRRVIRACIGKAVEKRQSKAALDLNPSLGLTEIQPCIGQKSNRGTLSPYIENKEDNKEERERAAPSSPPPLIHSKKEKEKPKIEKKAYRDNVLLSEAEHEKLLKQYGPDKLGWMLDYLEAKKGANGNVYESDYHVLLPANWVNTEYQKQAKEGKIDTSKSANNEHVFRNKKIAEFVEEKLRSSFTGYVYIQALTDHVLLYHKDKDIQKDIQYAAYETNKFKEIFLKEVERVFPRVREIFDKPNNSVNNLITDLAQQFKMTEAK